MARAAIMFAPDEEIREALGNKFPKHIYHSIVCIGALVAHKELLSQKSVFPTFMCVATFGVQEFCTVEFCSSV
jgi:hypothetical protein